MSDWINVNMENGVPPNVDNYVSIINELDSKSVYEYRAYAVVDNTHIFGDIKVGITKTPLPKVPIVVTGEAINILTNSITLPYNKVTDLGSSNIVEYGVLYTQTVSQGNETKLVYDNNLISKKGLMLSINLNEEFLLGNYGKINGLQPGRNVYFRSFAKNSEGIGYGEIKIARTQSN